MFSEDCRGKDFRADAEFLTRPAVTIRVSCPAHPELGEHVTELPEVTFPINYEETDS
jgi:hypothetical protein